MTNKEINMTRSELRSWCLASMSTPPNRDEQVILKLIDDLCEGARQPDSLVGRRVLIKRTEIPAKVIECGPSVPVYIVEFDDGDTRECLRDDFELLEGTNA